MLYTPEIFINQARPTHGKKRLNPADRKWQVLRNHQPVLLVIDGYCRGILVVSPFATQKKYLCWSNAKCSQKKCSITWWLDSQCFLEKNIAIDPMKWWLDLLFLGGQVSIQCWLPRNGLKLLLDQREDLSDLLQGRGPLSDEWLSHPKGVFFRIKHVNFIKRYGVESGWIRWKLTSIHSFCGD